MTRLVTRILLALATAWPGLYIVFLLVMITVATTEGGGSPSGRTWLSSETIGVMNTITVVLTALVLVPIYTIHAYRSERVSDERRATWIVLLVCLNAFTMPIYYWRYVRGQNGPNRARPVLG